MPYYERRKQIPNYWVVGAIFDGNVDESEKFIRRGYWFLGWSDNDQREQAKLRDQIKKGDRIAIKKDASPRLAKCRNTCVG